MELITDLKAIGKEIGLRLEESSLYPKLNLDAYKDVTPILIKKDKQYALLLKEVETGNFTPGGAGEPALKKRKVKVIYYSSYFTWEKVAKKRADYPPDEVTALGKAFKAKGFKIYPDMAVDRFRRLAKGFDLTFAAKPGFKEKTWVYRIDSKKAESPFLRKRGTITRWAMKAVDRELEMNPEDRQTVKKFLRQPPFRGFKVLDRLMKENGMASLLGSSPINLQEMLGIPYDQIESGLLGLYTRGRIYLLSQRPIKAFGLKKEESVFPTLREAIGKLAGEGSLGVEEKHLDIGRALTLGLDRLQNASNLFRAWREVRSGQDLGSYIIGALATKEAMEGALVMAAQKIAENQPVYEKDVERKFFSLLKLYEKKAKTPVQLRPYFVVLHAGTRTPYPSLPGNFRLSAKMNSLKLDAGILVKDQGLILACSDLARSIVMDPTGANLYALLERSMLEAAIPGGKEGCTGEDVYWAGMSPLLREEKTVRGWKLLPPAGLLKKDYNRDIGHTFGKQESTTLFFKKGEKGQRLKSGMVSAIEYQWPYKGYALGVEDMFVVGPRHGINITR
jgi:hypothetical protein